MQYGETEDYKVNLVSDVGIEEESIQNSIEIIAVEGNQFTLKLNGEINENSVIEIHNTIGQLVYTTTMNVNESTTFTIDLSPYATGPYLVNVISDHSNSLIKLVKK